MNVSDVSRIVSAFEIKGKPVRCKECKAGHINGTFRVTFYDNGVLSEYILQKINTYVFKDVDALMGNIVGVTDYIRAVLEKNGGDAKRGTLGFVKTKDGKYYDEYLGGVWRMYGYIDGVVSYSSTESPELFEKAGYAFGNFQKLLEGYDASTLKETIANFHNTPKRFENFKASLEKCESPRKEICRAETEFVISRENRCSYITDGIKNGLIPLKVTHNDTKLNNILMDAVTGDPVCIIDLDTVMPGSALYDFGDAVRFGASNAAEDEKDLGTVFFRKDMFEAFTRGFIRGCDGSLTAYEIKSLPVSALILTLETGIRFLTDYLDGDVYFKTAYADHNLVRARNQFKLVSDIEKRMPEFDAIVEKYVKKTV